MTGPVLGQKNRIICCGISKQAIAYIGLETRREVCCGSKNLEITGMKMKLTSSQQMQRKHLIKFDTHNKNLQQTGREENF